MATNPFAARSGEPSSAANRHYGTVDGVRRGDRTLLSNLDPPISSTLVTSICFAAVVLSSVAAYLFGAPWSYVLTQNLCTRQLVLDLVGFDDNICDGDQLESELFKLRNWDALFSYVPSILLAVPMGVAADRYGRKIALVTALIGILLGAIWMVIVVCFPRSFGLGWVWSRNLFLLIGGGPMVVTNVFYTILADVTTAKERTLVFFRLEAIGLAATLLASPLTWVLMTVSVWVPVILALAILSLAILLVLLLPETLPYSEKSDPLTQPFLPSDNPNGTVHTSGADLTDQSKHDWKRRYSLPPQAKVIFAPFILPTLVVCIINPIERTAVGTIVEYASSRYDLTLGEASLVVYLSIAIRVVFLSTVLPAADWLLRRQVYSDSRAKDAILARMSVVPIALSLVLMGSSSQLILLIGAIAVYGLGSGFMGALRSLATSFVEQNQVSTLYALIGTIQLMAKLGLSPLLSMAFGWGLGKGNVMIGVAFWFAALVCAAIGVVFWMVRVPARRAIMA